ncbi:MAG: IS110 family transposase [Gammaproteobacteria bacterium]
MNVTTIGLDIAKTVFQAHGVGRNGKVVLRKKLTRAKVLEFFVNVPPCLVGLEVCPGAHYWARELITFGHTVKLMPAQYVKAYVKGNKNDGNDAEAICEAVSRPGMRFVAINTEVQQDIQMLHRIRGRLVADRTALINQVRGLLGEYGIVFGKGPGQVRRGLAVLLEQEDARLSGRARELLADLRAQLSELDERIKHYDKRVREVCNTDGRSVKVVGLPGIGPLTATALVAAVNDGKQFQNGRQMAANLGLTPREHSSGGKQRLLGITKRGNTYLRTLLIHGARTVLRHAEGKTDRLSRWALSVQARRGTNVASVALANKLARIAWALLARERTYEAHWSARDSKAAANGGAP